MASARRWTAIGGWLLLPWLVAPAAADVLSIPGSGNPEFVLGRLAEAFNASQTTHTVLIPPSTGTAGALRDVEQGKATLGRVGRVLKDEEKQRGLQFVPLGRDVVVFVAGAGVSSRSLSRAQVIDIYGGKLRDWRDVGGRPGPIRAVGREPSDASRQAISREIKAFDGMVFGDAVKVVHLDPQLIELLDRYPTSLGFLNRSALQGAKTPLVALALDGVEGSVAHLASGRYPLWLELGLVHRTEAPTAAAAAFLQFVQSPSGRRVLEQQGVLPAPTGVR